MIETLDFIHREQTRWIMCIKYIYMRGISGEHLYAVFFQSNHNGLEDISVMVIDKTVLKDSTRREGIRAYELNLFIPLELNCRDFGNSLLFVLWFHILTQKEGK